jgi:hypothetical protein
MVTDYLLVMRTDDGYGSVSFQLAQIKIGTDKVTVSIVLYIDGTFLKKGILIRPVYSEYRTPYRMLYRILYRLYIPDSVNVIVYDIVCSMESDSVLAVGCLREQRAVFDIKELCSKDMYLRFADGQVRCSRALYHLLVIDGQEVGAALMCDVNQFQVCTCPHSELDRTDVSFPYRNTESVKGSCESSSRGASC